MNKLSGALEEISKDPDFKSALEKYCAVSVYRNGGLTVKEDTKLVDDMTKAFNEK
ncbi:hypothetical protein [Anaeromassilibacillus sp. SJQ-1]|uniref:hypothetical protein n=1 Tax=Anaeromassilibacillus sp. SJQ-1 TaxID=3375419 RepID=UPI003989FCF0